MNTQNPRMRFACQPGCTRCCTQEGWIWLGAEDVPRLAAFRGMSTEEFRSVYVYSTKNTIRLRMHKGKCPFLEAEGCSVHPAKPTQCRAFPFWPEILESKKELEEAKRYCPGIGKGDLIPVETLMKSAQEMRKAYPHIY